MVPPVSVESTFIWLFLNFTMLNKPWSNLKIRRRSAPPLFNSQVALFSLNLIIRVCH